MPPVARGNSRDTVRSRTGRGSFCRSPITTSTDQCSGDTFVNSIGVVRIGDRVRQHNSGGCGTDRSPLTRASSKVFVNGKGAGRIGDKYTADNTVSSGSNDTFFG